MPRQNKPREVLAEDHLARRIAAERDARHWTNDGLAKRMTDVGCAMTGSAIFKIEKGEPRRRIVVDELVAFAKVFGVSPEMLLLPPEAVASEELGRLLLDWHNSHQAALVAGRDAADAWDALSEYVSEHPDVEGVLSEVLRGWSEENFADDHDFRVAHGLWKLTKSESAKAFIDQELEKLNDEQAAANG